MTALLSVLEVICLAVGAAVLYAALMVGIWAGIVRLVRRQGAEAEAADARARDLVLLSGAATSGAATSGMTNGGMANGEMANGDTVSGGMVAAATAARGTTSGGGAGRERRARRWEDLPAWLTRDREWAVAVVLLGSPEIRDRTEHFIDFSARLVDWPGLLRAAGRWRPNERLLVASAYDLAGRPGGADGSTGSTGSAGSTGAADVIAPAAVRVPPATAGAGEPVTLADLALLLDEDEIRRVNAALEVRRGRTRPADALAGVGAAEAAERGPRDRHPG